MKVSIIIPVYNVASYIRSCLLSVLQQTYTDIEVVLVNDKTQDESMKIIQDTLNENPTHFSVKIVDHTENKGLSAARNTGIRNSTGEYLYFLDSDDEITHDCIETLVAQVGTWYPDMVVGDYSVQGSDNFYPPLRMGTSVITGKQHVLNAYVRGKIYVMAWNKLVQRNFILSNNLFFKEGLIHEDCLWSFQCACHANKLAVIKHITYYYKIRENSITTRLSQEREIRDNSIVLSEIIQYANQYNLLKNKYVAQFIEKEKLRLYYIYQRFPLVSSLKELHTLILSLPKLTHFQLLRHDFAHRKRLVRDAYYFLPLDLSQLYYCNLDRILQKYAYGSKKNTRSFYRWFLTVLFYFTLRKFPQKFHLPNI